MAGCVSLMWFALFLHLQPGESWESVYRWRWVAAQSRLHHTVLDHLATAHPHRRPRLHPATASTAAGPSAGRRRQPRWCPADRRRGQSAANTSRDRAADRQRLNVAWRRRRPPGRSGWAAATESVSHGGGGGDEWWRRGREDGDVDSGVGQTDDVSTAWCR